MLSTFDEAFAHSFEKAAAGRIKSLASKAKDFSGALKDTFMPQGGFKQNLQRRSVGRELEGKISDLEGEIGQLNSYLERNATDPRRNVANVYNFMRAEKDNKAMKLIGLQRELDPSWKPDGM